MSGLGLKGMAGSFDEAVTTGVQRKRSVTEILTNLLQAEAAHLQLHQPLGAIADHLAQKVRVRALLHQRPQVHHLVGHVWTAPVGQAAIGLIGDQSGAVMYSAC